MRKNAVAHAVALALLGLALAASCSLSGPADTPTIQTSVYAIPKLEVDLPASFATSPQNVASRAITGEVLDPASLDDIRSDAYVSFMKEIARTDGPDINAYIRRFQKHVAGLASVASGADLSMSATLGEASFSSSPLPDGGLETEIYWTLPHEVSAAAVAKHSAIVWPAANEDGTVSLTFHIYMDIVQDSSAALSTITFQLASVETCLPSGAGADAIAIPIVQVSAAKDMSAGSYELYSLYYGNVKYEKSVRDGESVSFIKQIKRPYPIGYDSATQAYAFPNGREYYYYGSGDDEAGGVTYLDYDPRFAANPADPISDIYLHREIFDGSGNLLFKQYGLTAPSNTKLLADYSSTGAVNLYDVLAAHTVSAGAGTGTVTTSPWKLTISYDIDSSGNMTAVNSVKFGGTTLTASMPIPPAGTPPKFYYEKSDGADSWDSGDAVYYPQGVTSVAGTGSFTVTQVFTRGFTVPNAASILGQGFYVGNRYPLKYMALSGNSDGQVAYDNATEGSRYSFYNWLGTPVTGQVWYDLNDDRHDDGSYVPKAYWVSKSDSPTATYDPKNDIKIAGVVMHKAYSLGTDPATGESISTLEYIPVLSTSSSSAPEGGAEAGLTLSGVYGELPLYLTFTGEAAVEGVLASLTAAETGGQFVPGTLDYATFLGSPTMSGFQPAASFPR